MRLVLRLLRELLRAVVFPLLWLRRRLAAPPDGYIGVEIDGPVRDIVAPTRFLARLFDLRKKHATSLHELARVLDEATADPRVRGVVVTLRDFHDGMATAQSLREILARARAAGRDVVVHLPLGADTKEMFVASGGSRVYVGPRATVAPLGFASHTRYFRRALDKLGVVPEVYAQGRYKSAGEQVMRETMSDVQREQLEALFDVFYDHLLEGIAEGRKLPRDAARGLVDGAPYHADEAIAARLVDGAAYEDEVPSRIGAKEPAHVVPASSYARARRAARFRRLTGAPVIAVIEVRGAIAHRGRPAFGAVVTDDAVIGAVRMARAMRRVRGVVLLIDSPGGSALASDRMHHELVQLAAEKPLVACMANVAASGGYYVAAPAHTIVAQPTTITGSIGVVAARAAFEPALEKLGIFTEVVRRGAHAEVFSATRSLTDDEQAVLRHQLEGTYKGFLQIVAEGRKRSVDEIATLAEGRVWSGKDAHRVGLVDVLGGFDVALAAVRARIGRGADGMEPQVIRGSRHASPLPLPKPDGHAGEAGHAALAALLDVAGMDARELAPLGLALAGERVLTWCAVR